MEGAQIRHKKQTKKSTVMEYSPDCFENLRNMRAKCSTISPILQSLLIALTLSVCLYKKLEYNAHIGDRLKRMADPICVQIQDGEDCDIFETPVKMIGNFNYLYK